ncbi:uncharacterized protein LOC144582057 [Callithrix jacchus]
MLQGGGAAGRAGREEARGKERLSAGSVNKSAAETGPGRSRDPVWKAGLSVRRLGTSRREQGKGTGVCAGKWSRLAGPRPRAHRAGPAFLLCPPVRTLGLVVRFPAAAPHSAPADPGSYCRAGEVLGSGFPAASPGAQSACAAQPPRRDTRGRGGGAWRTRRRCPDLPAAVCPSRL